MQGGGAQRPSPLNMPSSSVPTRSLLILVPSATRTCRRVKIARRSSEQETYCRWRTTCNGKCCMEAGAGWKRFWVRLCLRKATGRAGETRPHPPDTNCIFSVLPPLYLAIYFTCMTDSSCLKRPAAEIENMGTVKVNIKWGKETFSDVDVDLTQVPLVFKSQLFALSGVPPERQKVMVKGALLKDDDWGKAAPKEGMTIMMMGSAEAVPVDAPKNLPKFVEDLPEEEQEHLDTKHYGAGLSNLGNTCYMNSTLQCMFAVQPLRQALFAKGSGLGDDPSGRLVAATRELFKDLENGGAPFPPFAFLMALRQKFPQFAQQGPGGVYAQQDAEECWTNVMYTLREKLKVSSSGSGSRTHTRRVTAAGAGDRRV